ncbi:DNA-directed RNA polymerase II subunit RPB7, variant 2 [Balamuthia mandrillaris]
MVTAVVSIGKGQVVSGNGFVTFPITYKAVVFRPFKGEVVDAVVTQVNKMGFMAEVGPLQVFVSKHLIPSDMNFDANDECFVSDDESIRISKDDEVRLKIVGTRVDASELFSIGSIKEDFLGPIS